MDNVKERITELRKERSRIDREIKQLMTVPLCGKNVKVTHEIKRNNVEVWALRISSQTHYKTDPRWNVIISSLSREELIRKFYSLIEDMQTVYDKTIEESTDESSQDKPIDYTASVTQVAPPPHRIESIIL